MHRGAVRFADLFSFVRAEARAADECVQFRPVFPASVGSRVCCLLVDGDPAASVPADGSLAAGDVTVDAAFRAINTDGSGEISWQEWCVMADALLTAVPPPSAAPASGPPAQVAGQPGTTDVGEGHTPNPSPSRPTTATTQGSPGVRSPLSPDRANGGGGSPSRGNSLGAGVSPMRGAADAQLYDVMSMPSQRARRHDVWSQLFDCVGGESSQVVPFDDLADVVEAVAAGNGDGSDEGAAELVQWFARVLATTQVRHAWVWGLGRRGAE